MDNIILQSFLFLSDEVKKENGLRPSKNRLDCLMTSANYQGTEPFTNKKGMLFLTLVEDINYNATRKPQYSLTGQGLNFSGLIPTQIPNVFLGYPNSKLKLSNGKNNPCYRYKDDLFIICLNNAKTEMNVLIFKGEKAKADEHLRKLANGDYRNLIKELKAKRQPFYPYKCLANV